MSNGQPYGEKEEREIAAELAKRPTMPGDCSDAATPITSGLRPVAWSGLSKARAAALAASLRELDQARRQAWREIRRG